MLQKLRKGFGAAPAALIVIALLCAWWLYSKYGHLAPDVLPSPFTVAKSGWANRGDLWANTIPTLRATGIGFAFSIVFAVVLSVLIDSSSIIRKGVLPILIVSQTLPIIAIAPLAVIWFGFGIISKVLIVVLVTFFPLTISLVEGYESTDPEAENLLRTMGARRWRIFRSVRLPTAAPFFFSGLRISITYAIVGAIFAEYAGAVSGLGIYMQNEKNVFRTDLVVAAIVVTAVLTLVLFALTYVVEWLATPWQRAAHKNSDLTQVSPLN